MHRVLTTSLLCLATGVAAPEVEGADIDPRIAQRRANPADEPRRVLIDDIEHMAG